MSETIICRCSDVTEEDIERLIRDGYTSFDEIKRITRVGMGPCQGKTCSALIMRKLSQLTGKSIEELNAQTTRPPAIGVKLKVIAKEAQQNED